MEKIHLIIIIIINTTTTTVARTKNNSVFAQFSHYPVFRNVRNMGCLFTALFSQVRVRVSGRPINTQLPDMHRTVVIHASAAL